MAGLPSVYQDGTTSITTGTKAVVGQSTMFTKSLLPGDFYGAHRGFAIMIASIEDDTHLTLADNYPGPTQAAAAYKIMLQSDIGRHSEAIRQLLLKLSSGNIEAFAGLDGATDKFPFFTGAGTMDVGDVSPFARSNVLNKTDRAGLLAGIGVSDNVSAIPSTVSDLNSVVSNGWVWALNPGTLNCPGAGGFIVQTMMWNNPGIILQTAYDATSGSSARRQWVRVFYVTGWNGWVEQVQQSFPSVQEGGGLAQNGVGSNKVYIGYSPSLASPAMTIDASNFGRIWTDQNSSSSFQSTGYQKFPNGFMMQWGLVQVGGAADLVVTFPVAFATQVFSVTASAFGNATTGLAFICSVDAFTQTTFALKRRVASSGSLVDSNGIYVFYIAVGRWF